MELQTDSFKPRFRNFKSFTAEAKKFPPYNNFFAFFWENSGPFTEPHYWSNDIAVQFRKDHQHLSDALAKMVTQFDGNYNNATQAEWIEEMEPLLFVAYRMMESYVKVQELLAKNKDLLTQ